METLTTKEKPLPRLSFNQVQVLVHWAKNNHGRLTEVNRFKPHIQRRSTRALKDRNLVEFNPLFGTYHPTRSGEQALADHGYSTAGDWLGSNHPRKYR